MKASYLRQMQLVTPTELDFPIMIIGAGGIGSWVTLVLAKMGCANLTVIDFDKVEKHNLPSQFYSEQHIGKFKAVALREVVDAMAKQSITSFPDKFENVEFKTLPVSSPRVLICAVDSLKARQSIWPIIKGFPSLEMYVDARMGGETMRLLVTNMKDDEQKARYEKRLFSKTTKPHKEACSTWAIAYNTLAIEGMVGSVVKKYAKKEPLFRSFTFDINGFVTA